MGPAASGTPRAGVVLTDEGEHTALRRYLQGRLRLISAILAVASTGFYVLLRLDLWIGDDGAALNRVMESEALMHACVSLGAWLVFIGLSAFDVSSVGLKIADALVLYLGAGGALAWYAYRYRSGDSDVIALLAIFIIARAVVVPSTARRTLLLALPLPLTVWGIDLSHPHPYGYGGEALVGTSISSYRLWIQVTLWFGIIVAVVASHVTFSLRTKLARARDVGPYQLLEKLGGGGMGEVWRASHAALKRPTALKLLRPEVARPEGIRRFEHEVRENARLAHPNVIQIYDYGHTAEGIFYYAMEYLDGVDLCRLLAAHGPLPPGRVVYLLRQACAGLQAAHDEGLVHRDVKLENLIIFRRGRDRDVLKVVDFGLVKDLHGRGPAITQEGTFCGTPEVLAPEIALGAEPTSACDIYGLGAVGCMLLTGSPIFDGSSPLVLLGQHIHAPPIPPSERGVHVPVAMEKLLLRCLAKEPGQRPPSAAALACALEAADVRPRWTPADARTWWDAVDKDGSEEGAVGDRSV